MITYDIVPNYIISCTSRMLFFSVVLYNNNITQCICAGRVYSKPLIGAPQETRRNRLWRRWWCLIVCTVGGGDVDTIEISRGAEGAKVLKFRAILNYQIVNAIYIYYVVYNKFVVVLRELFSYNVIIFNRSAPSLKKNPGYACSVIDTSYNLQVDFKDTRCAVAVSVSSTWFLARPRFFSLLRRRRLDPSSS